MCTVTIDATQALARVIFSSNVYLGIEYDAKLEEVITIPQGETREITIYNAADTGPITFGISFSGASSLVASLGGAIALLLINF